MNICFNTEDYSIDNLHKLTNEAPFFHSGESFIHDWVGKKQSFIFRSSGSTGHSKSITVTRDQITSSVRSTATTLGLRASDRVLLCLSPEFVASKMMIARCLILDLNMVLVEPCSNPLLQLSSSEKIDFCSFVPYQIQKIIESGQAGQLSAIRNVLIGGAPISDQLQNSLKYFQNNIYHTFGMTETVSHIALRKLSQDQDKRHYKCLPGVEIEKNKENCLVIKGPVTNQKEVVTNDLVDIRKENEFIWLGRKDNLINSGGVKIIPEQVEDLIRPLLSSLKVHYDFFIGGMHDPLLGQKAVLILEGEQLNNDILKPINQVITETLGKYYMLKELLFTRAFVKTDSEKIKRKESLAQALKD